MSVAATSISLPSGRSNSWRKRGKLLRTMAPGWAVPNEYRRSSMPILSSADCEPGPDSSRKVSCSSV